METDIYALIIETTSIFRVLDGASAGPLRSSDCGWPPTVGQKETRKQTRDETRVADFFLPLQVCADDID